MIITDDLRSPLLGVGDRVEDRRPTIGNSGPGAKPVLHSTGIYGTVIALTDTGFRVRWEGDSEPDNPVTAGWRQQLGLPPKTNKPWEMGYNWSFWELGIRRQDQF